MKLSALLGLMWSIFGVTSLAASPIQLNQHTARTDRIARIELIAQNGAPAAQQAADPRGSLTEKGPALGLSAAEIQHVKQATGFFLCKEGQGTGALYGNGAQLVTSAHVV